MKASKILERLQTVRTAGPEDPDITGLVYDSRKAGPGTLFVCIVGTNSDSHRFLPQVFESGAAAVLVEKGHMPEGLKIPEHVAVYETEDTRLGLALASAAWFGYPAEQIPVIGVTGTKGKTTTTYMIRSILDHAGHKTGLIGTIEAIIGDQRIPSANTTPESYVVQKDLRAMIDAGCDCAVMEVSSQALKMHRTDGILFEIGVFTNISPDHIGPNEHSSFEEYMECKGRLFRQCRLGIVNIDDPHAADVLAGHTCEVETYGIRSEKADLRAVHIEHVARPGYLGMSFDVTGSMPLHVELDLPGLFSVYNALTAIACCEHFGIPADAIRSALKSAKVKGRIEPVPVSDRFTLMIDYAHNAMALESLLTTLRDYGPKRIVCVFGCGGNRARARRFEMGETAGRLADFTIITSDNPRFEDPQAILGDIVTGIRKTEGRYITIEDRKEAIRYAITHGEEGDVIVLAGKGHEDYQEIRGVKHPMDERVLIREILDEEALR
ncbi:UDP-N-acetylmuramoyl-L-alanyl-D-glutamate--2,6-diaminopimelate ligase [Chordicoccus furentiruminis]|uniref:UDP-N-acetylmuramoyl-L-alanyl-D-glutamate--2, 6-diaminopimelate ligase n=1 Tax=Chordicoccus furentiruminis TaxID=2709410 RepID=UPI0023A8F5C7|nr:UDP-N-acetylmuramoyl-L-alanyl-D-glutamate--2,6-diaminopimelate ligase [Chordicoccus furentiruminis]